MAGNQRGAVLDASGALQPRLEQIAADAEDDDQQAENDQRCIAGERQHQRADDRHEKRPEDHAADRALDRLLRADRRREWPPAEQPAGVVLRRVADDHRANQQQRRRASRADRAPRRASRAACRCRRPRRPGRRPAECCGSRSALLPPTHSRAIVSENERRDDGRPDTTQHNATTSTDRSRSGCPRSSRYSLAASAATRQASTRSGSSGRNRIAASAAAARATPLTRRSSFDSTQDDPECNRRVIARR